MKPCHVLVVEDDHYGSQVVRHMLNYQSIEGDYVGSGEEALQRLADDDNPYSLAILDLALPGMDGWTVLRELQRNPKTAHLPCVAITAYHDAKVAREALEAGFIAYFPKPLNTSFGKDIVSLCTQE